MVTDKQLLRQYRIKRLQRAVEYTLLNTIFLFFLLAFRDFYRTSLILVVAFLFFGMNFQLTQQREKRRTAAPDNRRRLLADMLESILFLGLIMLMGVPGVAETLLGAAERERYALVAAMLCGVFFSGMFGEAFFQLRRLPGRTTEEQENYIANLRRTIILPYINTRKSGK